MRTQSFSHWNLYLARLFFSKQQVFCQLHIKKQQKNNYLLQVSCTKKVLLYVFLPIQNFLS